MVLTFLRGSLRGTSVPSFAWRKRALGHTLAEYNASDIGQATRAAYSASDLGQASQAAYQAAYQADYRANIAKELRKQAEAWQKEHGNGREALDDEAAQAEVSDRDLFSPCKACCKT